MFFQKESNKLNLNENLVFNVFQNWTHAFVFLIFKNTNDLLESSKNQLNHFLSVYFCCFLSEKLVHDLNTAGPVIAKKHAGHVFNLLAYRNFSRKIWVSGATISAIHCNFLILF